jgi:sulfur-oxidizing protein SoxY
MKPKHPQYPQNPRREFLLAAGGIAAGIALESAATVAAAAETAASTNLPATKATVLSMMEAIHRVVGTATVKKGKVHLDLPPLVENGNTVALAVKVESPMTQADHVKAIHVFSEKNPQPYVASFYLGPRAGRASVATRVRLADTQTVVAICEMSDGSFWSDSANTVVTLAACTEEL